MLLWLKLARKCTCTTAMVLYTTWLHKTHLILCTYSNPSKEGGLHSSLRTTWNVIYIFVLGLHLQHSSRNCSVWLKLWYFFVWLAALVWEEKNYLNLLDLIHVCRWGRRGGGEREEQMMPIKSVVLETFDPPSKSWNPLRYITKSRFSVLLPDSESVIS